MTLIVNMVQLLFTLLFLKSLTVSIPELFKYFFFFLVLYSFVFCVR